MSVNRKQLLTKLQDAYAAYFDVLPPATGDPFLSAHYVFHSSNECFVLSKKVKLWSAETHEFVYVFSVPVLDAQIYDSCIRNAHEWGMQHIHPHIDHMSSLITAVFICDSCQEQAVHMLKKTRIHKDFMFSLFGWMEFRAAAVDLSTGNIAVNRTAGKDLEHFLLGNLKKCQES